MAPRITATIDNLTEADFDRLRKDGTGSRYEVMLDYTDGDHHELELHFRLVEQSATQYVGKHEAMAREREQFPLHEIHVGGLEGGGPVMHRAVETQIDRLSVLLAAMIELSKVSPQVLGIPPGDAPLMHRIRSYLRGY